MYNGELPTLSRDNFNDYYEDIILNRDSADYQLPEDFFETFITRIANANVQGAPTLTLPSPELFYLFEFSKLFKIGGLSSPYDAIEGSRVQIPQALTPVLKERQINISLLNNDGEYEEAPIYSFE
jgi:hypothetical protein